MRIPALAAAAALLLALAAPVLAQPLPVMVSVAPVKYITERIAGPLAQVSVLVPPGADAHTFEPKPSQMAQVAKTKLYLAQGVDFEHVWLPRLVKTNPGLVVVKTTAGIELMASEDHDHHDKHGQGREQAKHGKHDKADKHHDDKELDVHTWTSPRLAAVMAVTIAAALTQADPANASAYAANLQAFTAQTAELDASVRAALAGVKPGAKFLTFHPAWAYFAKEYGLEEVSIEVAGKEPGPKKLAEIIGQAKKLGVGVVFVQPQFSRKSAQSVADAVGASLVDADDLAEDWAANLVSVAQAIGRAAR